MIHEEVGAQCLLVCVCLNVRFFQLWEVDPSKHVPGLVQHTVGWPMVGGNLRC